ncbi:MAG: hypothetical protein AB7K37_04375 [Cyclobacteriaceae bacterium]
MIQYKYQLNHRLSLLPYGQYIEHVIEQLEREYGVSGLQFNHDRQIPHDSAETIPTDRLLIYANLFRITVEELRPAPQSERQFAG